MVQLVSFQFGSHHQSPCRMMDCNAVGTPEPFPKILFWLFKAVFEFSRVFNSIELNRNSKLRLFSVKLSCKQKIDEKNKAKYLFDFPILFHFSRHLVKMFPFFRDFLVEKTIARIISTFLLNHYEKLEK